MVEAYSNNVVVSNGASIPLEQIALEKGCSARLSGSSSINLNRKGIYEVTVSAYGVATSAGELTIQLSKSGSLQPQAISSITAADTTTVYNLGFTTLVQVPEDSTPCCCSPTTAISIMNTGVGVTFNHIDVKVSKLC